MGESPFKSDLFSGGRGGEAFSSLYHQQLADRMARGAGTKLVNSIVKNIEAKQAKEKGSGFKVQGSEKKAATRPASDQDPRAKAYMRSRPSTGKQSTFSLAA
jgi:Rod binding domain-containing protein